MKYQQAKESIVDWMEEHKDPYFRIADEIWENPELGMEEYASSKLVADCLEEAGFTVERGVAGMPTAFMASWGGGHPVLGFGSEYDALPGVSQKKDSNHPDPVVEGAPGHGCGHNLMAVTGPFAAIALKRQMEQENLTGTIKVFGTPAEELCLGKAFMGKAGLFEGVDAILDWHSMQWTKPGCFYANAYFNRKYHFKGKTAHGNAPWHGRSSLDAAMLMGHALELLREHIKPGLEGAANTLNYAFPDEGNAFPNVVPDHTTLWCIGRMCDAETVADALQRIDDCAKGAALATGTTVTSEEITATQNLLPNETLSAALEENAHWVGAPQFTEEENQAAREIQEQMGCTVSDYEGVIEEASLTGQPTTDASEYSWSAPTGTLHVQMAPSAAMGWHNWGITRFAGSSIGKKTLFTAAKILAATGYDLVMEPSIIKTATEEWKQRTGGKPYTSLLSDDAKPALDINKAMMDKFRK